MIVCHKPFGLSLSKPYSLNAKSFDKLRTNGVESFLGLVPQKKKRRHGTVPGRRVQNKKAAEAA